MKHFRALLFLSVFLLASVMGARAEKVYFHEVVPVDSIGTSLTLLSDAMDISTTASGTFTGIVDPIAPRSLGVVISNTSISDLTVVVTGNDQYGNYAVETFVKDSADTADTIAGSIAFSDIDSVTWSGMVGGAEGDTVAITKGNKFGFLQRLWASSDVYDAVRIGVSTRGAITPSVSTIDAIYSTVTDTGLLAGDNVHLYGVTSYPMRKPNLIVRHTVTAE